MSVRPRTLPGLLVAAFVLLLVLAAMPSRALAQSDDDGGGGDRRSSDDGGSDDDGDHGPDGGSGGWCSDGTGYSAKCDGMFFVPIALGNGNTNVLIFGCNAHNGADTAGTGTVVVNGETVATFTPANGSGVVPVTIPSPTPGDLIGVTCPGVGECGLVLGAGDHRIKVDDDEKSDEKSEDNKGDDKVAGTSKPRFVDYEGEAGYEHGDDRKSSPRRVKLRFLASPAGAQDPFVVTTTDGEALSLSLVSLTAADTDVVSETVAAPAVVAPIELSSGGFGVFGGVQIGLGAAAAGGLAAFAIRRRRS